MSFGTLEGLLLIDFATSPEPAMKRLGLETEILASEPPCRLLGEVNWCWFVEKAEGSNVADGNHDDMMCGRSKFQQTI